MAGPSYPPPSSALGPIRGLEIFVPGVEAMIGDLLDFARQWQPDLVVFEPTTYAGPLAAAALGIPAARHLWGIDFTLRTREFEPEVLAPVLDRLHLAEVETLGNRHHRQLPAELAGTGRLPAARRPLCPLQRPWDRPGLAARSAGQAAHLA